MASGAGDVSEKTMMVILICCCIGSCLIGFAVLKYLEYRRDREALSRSKGIWNQPGDSLGLLNAIVLCLVILTIGFLIAAIFTENWISLSGNVQRSTSTWVDAWDSCSTQSQPTDYACFGVSQMYLMNSDVQTAFQTTFGLSVYTIYLYSASLGQIRKVCRVYTGNSTANLVILQVVQEGGFVLVQQFMPGSPLTALSLPIKPTPPPPVPVSFELGVFNVCVESLVILSTNGEEGSCQRDFPSFFCTATSNLCNYLSQANCIPSEVDIDGRPEYLAQDVDQVCSGLNTTAYLLFITLSLSIIVALLAMQENTGYVFRGHSCCRRSSRVVLLFVFQAIVFVLLLSAMAVIASTFSTGSKIRRRLLPDGRIGSLANPRLKGENVSAPYNVENIAPTPTSSPSIDDLFFWVPFLSGLSSVDSVDTTIEYSFRFCIVALCLSLLATISALILLVKGHSNDLKYHGNDSATDSHLHEKVPLIGGSMM